MKLIFNQIANSMNSFIAGWGGAGAPALNINNGNQSGQVAGLGVPRMAGNNHTSQRRASVSGSPDVNDIDRSARNAGISDPSRPNISGTGAMNQNLGRSMQNISDNPRPSSSGSATTNLGQIVRPPTDRETQRQGSVSGTVNWFCNGHIVVIGVGEHLVHCVS